MTQVGSAEPGVIPHEGFSSDLGSFCSGSLQRLCFPTPLQLGFRTPAHGSAQPPSSPSSPYPQAIPCWDHRSWPDPELSTTACNSPRGSFPFPSLFPKSRLSAPELHEGSSLQENTTFLQPFTLLFFQNSTQHFLNMPLKKSSPCFTS